MDKENKVVKEFASKIIENNLVHALTLDGGYAKAFSNFFTDEDEVQIEIFCFWTSEENAKSCINDDWSDYKVVTLPLSVFMEDWCIGMSNENYGVGLDFNAEVSGAEADPLELLVEICEQLIENGVSVGFEKFKSVEEIKGHAIKALSYED